MARRITGLTLLLLAACQQGQIRVPELGKPQNTLSYSQYHSLEKGMAAKAILNAFGTPAHTLEQNGEIAGLTYYCEDAAGKVKQLRMVFGQGQRLEEWALVTPDRAKSPS